MKNKLKNLASLKLLSEAMLTFELKKYEVIAKFAETSDWNQVYVNDSRYELIRLIMVSNFVTKGFFTMSDLVGTTNLNTRSIERLISRSTKQIGIICDNFLACYQRARNLSDFIR